MGEWIGALGIGLLGAWYLHRWLQLRKVSPRQRISMPAEVYRAGDAWIIRRQVQDPDCSVVVMHGFLENPLYFTRHYQDPGIELIMIGSAGYHLPLCSPQYRSAPWPDGPSGAAGTIAGDAQVLNLAMEHLVSSDNIRVHGHSRGAAVALEAARQRPELFIPVEVILEAPVLPQGRLYRPPARIAHWLLPLVHLLWQRKPGLLLANPVWGPLHDPYKRELLMALPFNAQSSEVLMTNLDDLSAWMRSTGADIYRHVHRGAVLVPGGDRVLDSEAMLDSARQAENLQIIEVPDGSHFVLLDNPESIPPLIRNR